MPKRAVHWEYLYDGTTQWKEKSFTNGSGVYSNALRPHFTTGFGALLVILADTPDVDITYQTSLDGKNWYSPVDTSGNSLATISTALVASAWIVFSPQVAEYVRFYFDPDANSTVTAIYIQQEEN